MKQFLSLPDMIGQSIHHSSLKIFGSSPKMTITSNKMSIGYKKMTNKVCLFFTLFILIFSLTFSACKKKDKTDNSGLQAATEAKQSVVSTGSTTADSGLTTEASSSSTTTRDPSKIDLDLTKMSATMIFSTMFDMLVMPEDYIEKNIKVSGWFETYTDPQTGELYYAVVVPDATACCQQGLEFVWPGDHKYPEDFPAVKQDITVTGLYKLIETDGVTYTYLEASKVEF